MILNPIFENMAAMAVPAVPKELMSISMSVASSAAAPPASYLRRFSASLRHSRTHSAVWIRHLGCVHEEGRGGLSDGKAAQAAPEDAVGRGNVLEAIRGCLRILSAVLVWRSRITSQGASYVMTVCSDEPPVSRGWHWD